MTSPQNEKLITSVQKKKRENKGAKKKLLLGEITQRLQGEEGYAPSLNEAIIAAAESFLNDMRLHPKQREKIEQAARVANLTPQQILDKACDWADRFYGSKYAGSGESMEKSFNPSKKGSGAIDEFSPGSAYQRIHEFVQKLIKQNDQTKHPEDKVFINQTYLTKHQGSNRDAIRGYLHTQKEMLDKHHKKHELSPRHNVEVHSYRKRGLDEDSGKASKKKSRGKKS